MQIIFWISINRRIELLCLRVRVFMYPTVLEPSFSFFYTSIVKIHCENFIVAFDWLDIKNFSVLSQTDKN